MDVEETYKPDTYVFKGPTDVTMNRFPATGWSDALISFNNIIPPDLTTVVEKTLRVHYQLAVNVAWVAPAGTAAGQATLFSCLSLNNATGAYVGPFSTMALQNTGPAAGVGSMCLRALPLQSCLTGADLMINGNSTNLVSSDIACLFPHLFLPDEIQRFSTEFPCTKDDKAIYTTNDVAANRSPFAQYGQNPYAPSRAAFLASQVFYQYSLNGAPAYGAGAAQTGGAQYLFDIVEQLIVPPASWGNRMDTTGLTNIFNITLNLKIGDITKALSTYLSGTIAGANNFVLQASVVGLPAATLTAGGGNVNLPAISCVKPEIYVQFNTPDPILAAKAPASQILPYEAIVTQQQAGIAGLSSASANPAMITYNAQQLNSIPAKLYFYVKPQFQQSAVKGYQVTDTFLRITGATLRYGNKICLSTFTEFDLWKMSVENGLQQTYNDWRYSTGSILIIDPAKDLGLSADECSGQSNRFVTCQMMLTVTVDPLKYAGNTLAVDYVPMIGIVSPGFAVISKTRCQFILGGVDPSKVLSLTADAGPHNKIHEDDLSHKTSGGSLLGRVGNVLHKGLSAAKHVAQFVTPDNIERARAIVDKLSGKGLSNQDMNNVSGAGVVGAGMPHKHKRAH